jgi:hypothetical protein
MYVMLNIWPLCVTENAYWSQYSYGFPKPITYRYRIHKGVGSGGHAKFKLSKAQIDRNKAIIVSNLLMNISIMTLVAVLLGFLYLRNLKRGSKVGLGSLFF